MMSPSPRRAAVVILLILVTTAVIAVAPVRGRNGAQGAGPVSDAADGRQQATVTPQATAVLPDLVAGWRYDHWWSDCIKRHQPWILTLVVVNRGGAAAGPFVVQDGRVAWSLAGLEAGQTQTLREWGGYPDFPLVVDVYDQVAESVEGNNVVAPPVNATWSPTPRFAEANGTPAPPSTSGGRRLEPARVMTLPVFCPTRTPVPTTTPMDEPIRADLVVADSSWAVHPIIRQGSLCLPPASDYRFTLTIRNQGAANAHWFSVRADGSEWHVMDLAAGASQTLASQPRYLPMSVVVDYHDEVEESDETNNSWLPPRNGTPTPAFTPPPLCVPTLTPTPVAFDQLPDLRLGRLSWQTAALGRPLCLGPLWRLTLAIHNDGRTAAGPFVVTAGDFTWSFDGAPAESDVLGPGGPLNVVTWPILIDALDQVRERDETNNRVERNTTLTATPTGTPPPTCSPTPRPVTVTYTPRPPWTVTPTLSPTSATPSRTPTPTARALALPRLGRP